MVSDFPIMLGDRTQNINTDKHIAPIMLGKISGNYMQPLVAGSGYGLCMTKCFDYLVEGNEVFDYAVGAYLIGSDINKLWNNRIVRAHAAHIRIFSTGTFGSQNEVKGNDLSTAGSVNCVYIQSNDRHARIIDNYLEEAYGPCLGFIDISQAAVPATVGPNARSTIFSIVCQDNRIDGHAFATSFVYRVDAQFATSIILRDTNTTGIRSTITNPFFVVGGGLKGCVGSGNAHAQYDIQGTVFGLYDGYRSSNPHVTPRAITIDNTVTKSIQVAHKQNSECIITGDSFRIPASLPVGSAMVFLPWGRAGRTYASWLRPGATYRIDVKLSTGNAAGGVVSVAFYSNNTSIGYFKVTAGNRQVLGSGTFTAPSGIDDLGLIVTKGTGTEGNRVDVHSISIVEV